MNLTRIAVAGTTALAGMALLAAPATAAGTHQTKVIANCTSEAYKPTHYTLTCADGYTQIKHATYSSWTRDRASGSGVFVYNTCEPTCVAGTIKHYRMTFSLHRPRSVHGARLFTRLTVHHGSKTESFHLMSRTI